MPTSSITNTMLMQLICLSLICTIVIFINAVVVREIFKDRPPVQARHRLYTVVFTLADILVAWYYLSFSLMKLLEYGDIVKESPLCSNWNLINSVSLFSSVLGLFCVTCDFDTILKGGVEYENWIIARKFLVILSWVLLASILYLHANHDSRKWLTSSRMC